MEAYLYLGILSGLASFGFGVYVLFAGPRRLTTYSLSLFAILSGLWAFSLYFYVKPIFFDSEFWIKITYLLVMLFIAVITYFVCYLPRKDQYTRLFLPFIVFYGLTSVIFIFILFRTDLWVVGVEKGFYGLETILGPAYSFWGAAMIFPTSISYYILFRRLRVLQGREKNQIQIFLISYSCFGLGAIILDIIFPLFFKTTRFFWLSSLLNLLVVALNTYAIIRYRFIDVRWAIGRGGIFLVSLLVVAFYCSGFFFFLRLLDLGDFFSSYRVGFILAGGAGIVFFYSFHFLEEFAGKYFYYTLYSLKKSTERLAIEISHTVKLERIVDLIIQSLRDSLALEKVGIAVKDYKRGKFVIRGSFNLAEEKLLDIIGGGDSFLLSYFSGGNKLLARDDIPLLLEKIKAGKDHSKQKEELMTLAGKLEKEGIAVFMPFLIENRLIGIMALGEKSSGVSFSAQEISLLNFLTAQSAIAINNALSYDEIERKKEELERFYHLTIGRELKMIELKEKIKELERNKS